MFNDVTFAYPWVLFFLAIVPAMLIWYWKIGKKRQSAVTYSSLGVFHNIPPSWRERLRHFPMILRTLAVAVLIVALARPQSFSSGQNVTTEGIDIMLCLDMSGSMTSEDLKPNRIDAAKAVAEKFVESRPNDRIGLVIFGRQAFTQCPITIDHRVLLKLLREVKIGMVNPDGTAIGNAIADAVGRLKDGQAKSKVIVLLTDGENNAGEIDPLTAAELAKTYGVRVFTIGVGTNGEAPYPIQTPFGVRYQMVPVQIDVALLQKIADMTGGEFFRATNNRALVEIYKRISELTKSKIKVTSYRNAAELFPGWLDAGLILLFLEIGMSRVVLKRVP